MAFTNGCFQNLPYTAYEHGCSFQYVYLFEDGSMSIEPMLDGFFAKSWYYIICQVVTG